jgi:predicted ATPase
MLYQALEGACQRNVKTFLESYSVGVETGDLEFAAHSLNAYSYCSYFTGRELTGLEQICELQ